MANTFTNLMPHLYEQLRIVSREMVGYTKVARIDAKVSQAAIDEEIRVPFAPKVKGVDIVPSMSPPTEVNQEYSTVPIKLTKQRSYPFSFSDEEMKVLDSGGNLEGIESQSVAEALRTCFNEVETDLASSVLGAKAIGTAGTTPFAADHKAFAKSKQYLDEAGCPAVDRVAVIDTSSMYNLNTLSNLTAVNTAGTTETLRRGIVSRLTGFDIYNSAQTVSKGPSAAQTGYLINGSPGIGATKIPVDTGSTAIGEGAVFSIAGNPTKYVALEGSTTTEIRISDPGLVVAAADDAAITFQAAYAVNAAFHRPSLILGLRAPARKVMDGATDVIIIKDGETGLMAEFSHYGVYRMSRFEVALCWGYKFLQPEHSVVIMG